MAQRYLMALRRSVSAALALAVSGVCAAMAAAAAAERAATSDDRVLVTAVAVALVLGAHLLPALAARRNRLVQALFVGCVLATLYHHAHYFAGVQQRAGAQRAAVVAPSGHAQALQAELQAHAAARALPTVAADLAQASVRAAQAQAALARCAAQSEGRCHSAQASVEGAAARVQALQDERASALRAGALRTQLADAAAGQDRQRAAQAGDPVDARLAAITGLDAGVVALLSSLLQSLLLELMAALLWTLALPTPVVAVAAAEAGTAAAASARAPIQPAPLPTEAVVSPLVQPSGRTKTMPEHWRCWPVTWRDRRMLALPFFSFFAFLRKLIDDFQQHPRAHLR